MTDHEYGLPNTGPMNSPARYAWSLLLGVICLAAVSALLYAFTAPPETTATSPEFAPLVKDTVILQGKHTSAHGPALQGLPSLRYLLQPYLYYGHLPAILCAVVVVFSGFCLGRHITNGARTLLARDAERVQKGGVEQTVIDTVTGLWLMSVALFLAFCLHLGQEVLIGLIVLVGIGPLFLWDRYLREAWHDLHEWSTKRRRESRWGRSSRWDRLLLLLTGGFLLLSAIMALAPPHQSDAMRYHLAVPALWLQEGGFAYLPGVAFSNFPFMLEMLFAIPLALEPYLDVDSAARLLHWVWLLLLCGAVHSAATRVCDRRAGRIAAALVATTPFVPVLASWAFVEVALACTIVLAFSSLQRWADSESRYERQWWRMRIGLLIGIGMSIKYTAFPLALVLAGCVMLGRPVRSLQLRLRDSALVLVIALVVAAPWLLKSLYYTGNPVYPLANRIFQSEDWSPREASLYYNHARLKGNLWQVPYKTAGQRLTDLATLPWRLVRHPEMFGGWPVGLAWLGLLPLALLFPPRHLRTHALLTGALVCFLLWTYTYRDNRFLLPCLSLLAAPLAANAAAMFQAGGLRNALCSTALVLVFAANTLQAGASCLGPNNVLDVVSGATSKDTFLSRPDIADYYPAFVKLEDIEEAQPLVLITGQEMAYYSPLPHIWSDFFNTPLLVQLAKQGATPGELRSLLRQRNITHLLVNHERLRHGTAYRRLYDLHFLDDSRTISPLAYARYLGLPLPAGIQETDDTNLLDWIVAAPARELHDAFLHNEEELEEVFTLDRFGAYALR